RSAFNHLILFPMGFQSAFNRLILFPMGFPSDFDLLVWRAHQLTGLSPSIASFPLLIYRIFSSLTFILLLNLFFFRLPFASIDEPVLRLAPRDPPPAFRRRRSANLCDSAVFFLPDMLLRALSPADPPTELRLCLRHVWRHCNPADPEKFFAVGTAWTDAEGTRIQGDSLRAFAPYLEKNVCVGSVYAVTGFTLQPPRPSYRACRFPHWLTLGPAAKYELLPPEVGASFKPESYEFVPFAQLSGRLPPCAYLTDFVGKVIGIGKPNHVPRGSGVAPVQTVVVIDASGLEVEVSLWSELSNVLDPDSIPLDDVSNPVIVAFLSFQIRPYMGSVRFLLCFHCRIAGRERSVRYIVPKFDTPEKLKKHMQDSYRTIHELEEMLAAAGDPEPCYRCSAEIIGFDDHQPWFYKACPDCSSAIVPYGADFWCKKHDTVLSAAITYRYRLKLFVSDSTSKTTFVLLGHAADRIIPISASELALAYPEPCGPLPQTLQMMIGQTVVFGVHLPRNAHANSYEDFRVSKMWGLNLPRAQLLAQLPAPRVPYRTPSPPSRHETPIPPDPAYVPPIPTYRVESHLPSPDPVLSTPLPRYLFAIYNPDIHIVPAATGKRKAPSLRAATRSASTSGKNKSAAAAPPPKTPAQQHSRPVSTTLGATLVGHTKTTPGPALPSPPSDDDTLLSALRPRKRQTHTAQLLSTPPTPTGTGLPHQQAPQPLSDLPLARVKLETLSSAASTVSHPHGVPGDSSPSADFHSPNAFRLHICSSISFLSAIVVILQLWMLRDLLNSDTIQTTLLQVSVFVVVNASHQFMFMISLPFKAVADLQAFNADITDLDFGENNYTCLFRLICFWDETNDFHGVEGRSVYSQWIDLLEHRIEGYAEPGESDAVKELLVPGAIYRIQNPFLIPARRIRRSCPGDFALQIRPANLVDRVHENPTRPFFPLQSFNIPTMASLRAVDQARTSSSDIVGRLSEVTRPTSSPAGGLSFKLLLDHPSNERIAVRFVQFRPRTPIDLRSVAVLERQHPVVCIVTAVTITNPGGDMLIFENTPASRIVFPPFVSTFRPYFDLYSALAKCADSTATTNILFCGAAASLLFRMPPEEYVMLTETEQQALLNALQGHLFIVEVRPAEPGDMERAQFIATTIWDPVTAFY
ncbi:Replication protein A 70 kDa DNA-binding subunit E, partial [Linum grandiflorum]